jgi:hypothetical protein
VLLDHSYGLESGMYSETEQVLLFDPVYSWSKLDASISEGALGLVI